MSKVVASVTAPLGVHCRWIQSYLEGLTNICPIHGKGSLNYVNNEENTYILLLGCDPNVSPA